MPTPTSSPEINSEVVRQLSDGEANGLAMGIPLQMSGPRGNGYDVTTMPVPAEAACAPLDDDEFGEGIIETDDDAE